MEIPMQPDEGLEHLTPEQLNIYEQAKFFLNNKISVIPVGPDKRPLVAWAQYQTRYATMLDLQTWWKKWPDAQLGMVTGEISRVTVVDVEVEGDPSFLPQDTVIARTGGGGWHYYFQYDKRIRNSARKLAPFTDIRGNGGYVVLPPSKSSKGEYTWYNKTMEYAKLPEELVQKLLDRPISAGPSVTFGDIPDYEGSGEGGRNDAMTRYAGKILPEIHPLDWDTIGWQKFLAANQKNTPPLPEYELRRTWESIKSAEKSNPSNRAFRMREEEPEKEPDPEDVIMPMGEVAKFDEVDFGEPVPTGIEILDRALVGGIRPGDLIGISGESGHGKTTFAQTITANWVDQGVPVLFFTYEVLVSEIWDKFQEMELKNGGAIWTPRKAPDGRLAWVREKIREGKAKGIKMVVIDHLEFLTADNKLSRNVSMNFSHKVSEAVKEVKNIAREEKVAILLLFHLRKINQGRPTLTDAKDSISIVQESDAGIIVERQRTGNAKDGDEFYSPMTIVSLQKNRRKGGKTCYVNMHMLKGRLVEMNPVGIESEVKASPAPASPIAAPSDEEIMEKEISRQQQITLKFGFDE